MNDWIKIEEMDDLPKKQTKKYEQYDCLIFDRGEIKHRVYNCEHQCWDDADGDDHYCGPLEPSHYMMFPDAPEEK